MKIVTVVGARPQFIKAAALSRELRKEHQEILVHTGQHYDKNMSDVFFEELKIPLPDYNLSIAGGTHGKMTGRMLEAIEEVLIKEKPDMLLVYGDTNSTLAGALAAVKLHIPVIHVEAGVRLGTLENPEEINRILTDKVSEFLFVCTKSAIDSLKKEGQTKNVFMVGDPMYDAFLFYQNKIDAKQIILLDDEGNEIAVPTNYNYLTCHRQENTDDENKLLEIMAAMNSLDMPTIYPVHPRNKNMAYSLKQKHGFANVILTKPVSYKTSIWLVINAQKIVTDSGGVQREAFFAGVQCVTVFDHVVWIETMVGNCNQLATINREDILSKLSNKMEIVKDYKPFGDGHSCEKICDVLKKYSNKEE